jgi:hypothetical protein
MKRKWIGALALVLSVFLSSQIRAQKTDHDGDSDKDSHHLTIKSFAVEIPDNTLTYPGYLVDIPDEHTTLMPVWAWPYPFQQPPVESYLVFASSSIKGGSGGAVALQTTDLSNFAAPRGYAEQVMTPPVAFTACDPMYDLEFDENYSAPGSVVQDPTLPPGNLIMIYEAENHCPSGKHQQPFYATVGFARSSDNGQTWPPPANGEFGNADRHPVFTDIDPEPPYQANSENMGDALPSAFVDINDWGEAYLYVTYGYAKGPNRPLPTDGLIRVGRAKLGEVRHEFGNDFWEEHGGNPATTTSLKFYKWYQGSFSQPAIAGLDSGVIPTTGCTGRQVMPGITRNDELGLYFMIFLCNPSSTDPSTGKTYAAWYYSTATSLERQDWSEPQPILNSEHEIIAPCNLNNPLEPSGSSFDGFYPSFMTPDAPAGHIGLTGLAFFLNGCDTGLPRTFGSRKFTITTEP